MQLFKRPIVITIMSVGLWLLGRHLDVFRFLSENDEVGISATITTLGLIYWLVAAAVLATVWSQWIQTEDAAFEKNSKRFWELAERRMPKPVKTVLAFISFFLWAAFFFMPYNSIFAGVFTILSITTTLSLVWEIAVDLDNPLSGIWRIKNIPPK
ncbi:hypothetical protein HY967_01740 [Candidatus Jorgensenbacteria bacterium]|nr:hypothetical protein [Candidatus Jorgensenbacteria bacterium]